MSDIIYFRPPNGRQIHLLDGTRTLCGKDGRFGAKFTPADVRNSVESPFTAFRTCTKCREALNTTKDAR